MPQWLQTTDSPPLRHGGSRTSPKIWEYPSQAVRRRLLKAYKGKRWTRVYRTITPTHTPDRTVLQLADRVYRRSCSTIMIMKNIVYKSQEILRLIRRPPTNTVWRPHYFFHQQTPSPTPGGSNTPTLATTPTTPSNILETLMRNSNNIKV